MANLSVKMEWVRPQIILCMRCAEVHIGAWDPLTVAYRTLGNAVFCGFDESFGRFRPAVPVGVCEACWPSTRAELLRISEKPEYEDDDA